MQLLDLPEEVLLRIFSYVSQPWFLQIKTRHQPYIGLYYTRPKIQPVPSPFNCALFAACRLTHRLIKAQIPSSFAGTISSLEAPGIRQLPPFGKN